MKTKTNQELQNLVDQAVAGNRQALETLLAGVEDMVFNLSLRMLGTFADAQDAAQDILLKVMTHLSTFRGESSFTTWVFRIAINHLKNYKKHMFAHHPISFEYYGKRKGSRRSRFDAECGKGYSGGGIKTLLHECNAAMP